MYGVLIYFLLIIVLSVLRLMASDDAFDASCTNRVTAFLCSRLPERWKQVFTRILSSRVWYKYISKPHPNLDENYMRNCAYWFSMDSTKPNGIFFCEIMMFISIWICVLVVRKTTQCFQIWVILCRMIIMFIISLVYKKACILENIFSIYK